MLYKTLKRGEAVKFRSSSHGTIYSGIYQSYTIQDDILVYLIKPNNTRNCSPESIWKIKPSRGHQIWVSIK